jgi:hypothetical protein
MRRTVFHRGAEPVAMRTMPERTGSAETHAELHR